MTMNISRILIIIAPFFLAACQPQNQFGGGGEESNTPNDRLVSQTSSENLSGNGNPSSSDGVSEGNSESCSVGGASAATFTCPVGLNSFETWLPFGDVAVVDGGTGQFASADLIEFQEGSSLIGYVRFQDVSAGSTIGVSISAENVNSDILALTVIEGCSSLNSPSETGFISFADSSLGSASVEVVASEPSGCFTVVLNPLAYPATYRVWNLQHSIQ